MVLGDNDTPDGGACNPGPSNHKNIGIVSNIATPHSQVFDGLADTNTIQQLGTVPIDICSVTRVLG